MLRFFKKLKVDKEDSILDFGCGSGALLTALKTKGFTNIHGYEPHNKKYSGTLKGGQKYNLVYSTYVFEHLFNFDDFFADLDRATKSGSRVFVICDTATRIPKLDPACLYQRCSIHAPFHTVLPSDDAVTGMFLKKGYRLAQFFPYDVQRSGLIFNNRVIAIFLDRLGDTKDKLISATWREQVLCLLKSPFSFFNALLIDTKDPLTSSFVFTKV
ncbi:MAG: methyltransferase domain-containing protein [Deltaproteobacteria bacterium]|nr:methyltransferase domain-containing protein [Deltaproteobacteria bacterium]